MTEEKKERLKMRFKYQREALMKGKHKRCRYCWGTDLFTIDHKKPVILGGKTERNNMQWLCKRCNGYKGRMSHTQFKNLLKVSVQILKERQENEKETKIERNL